MSLKIMPIPPVPEETARITYAAFPRGTLLVQIRNELGTLYTDDDFLRARGGTSKQWTHFTPTASQPVAQPCSSAPPSEDGDGLMEYRPK